MVCKVLPGCSQETSPGPASSNSLGLGKWAQDQAVVGSTAVPLVEVEVVHGVVLVEGGKEGAGPPHVGR